MTSLHPPLDLRSHLDDHVFQRAHLRGLPPLASADARPLQGPSRRHFLQAASAGLLAFSAGSQAAGSSQLIFSPEDDRPPAGAQEMAPGAAGQAPQLVQQETLRLGEIPQDFWYRPRELWLRRQGTRDEIRIVYWKDGRLIPEGYWQACALLRDVRANVMTTMDPTVLDILRGIIGFYQAWQWPHPVVVTSGFRTLKTNAALEGEGAAKNSMHLYGKASDLYIPGIPSRDVGALAAHLRQGGVGFYPSKGFTHLDTGRLRIWRGA